MENQPKLNSSKEIITLLAGRFPQCFSAEGETHPLKVGIFRDLVERVGGEMDLGKTQLHVTLRLYTSNWHYLYGVKAGTVRVDPDGNPCSEPEEQHTTHTRQQLEEARARVQTQRTVQQAKKCEATTAAGQQDEGVRHERKLRPQQSRRKGGAERRRPRPVVAEAPRKRRRTLVSGISVLTVDQALKVEAGNNTMDATALEITKDNVRIQLTSGMSMIVRVGHLMF